MTALVVDTTSAKDCLPNEVTSTANARANSLQTAYTSQQFLVKCVIITNLNLRLFFDARSTNIIFIVVKQPSRIMVATLTCPDRDLVPFVRQCKLHCLCIVVYPPQTCSPKIYNKEDGYTAVEVVQGMDKSRQINMMLSAWRLCTVLWVRMMKFCHNTWPVCW